MDTWKFSCSRNNFVIHTKIKGTIGKGLCKVYPPPDFNYISFATSWLLSLTQFPRGYFDMENNKKQTVLWNKKLPLESIDVNDEIPIKIVKQNLNSNRKSFYLISFFAIIIFLTIYLRLLRNKWFCF